MKDFNLSNKEWVNLKTILNGMFEYACRMKYLQEIPDALSRKKDTTSAQETDSITSAQKPDNEVATTVNTADNVVSLEAFQSIKLTVPKMSSNVPTFSNA